ncbi:hypothetical protein EOL70_13555 [Leucothrix sargassi]|nr:hypothetical protein EOL70_13555 [Leucothrix sargassi]
MSDDNNSGFPRTVFTQLTREAALRAMQNDVGDDTFDPSDSENEDSISALAVYIGESIEEKEIDSWEDIEDDEELSSNYHNTDKDIRDYQVWLQSREY